MITRDAKIGLLVVLAFCLIVGILLSEHVTTAGPQQASLAQAGQSARRATNSPAAISASALATTVIDADPQPRQLVVTRDVIDAPVAPSPTARIELGRPVAGEMKVIRVDSAPDAVAGAVQVAVPAETQPKIDAVATAATPPAIKPLKLTDSTLQTLAKQNGLELVAVGADAKTSPKVGPQPVALAATATTATTSKSLAPAGHNVKVKEFVAQPGDTLSKMAGRALGLNTPANRQAIVDLNPSLQKNPERILVGAKYLVPADAWAAALDVAETPAPVAKPAEVKPAYAKPVDERQVAIDVAEAKVDAAAAKLAKSKAAPTAPVLYEVKPGDSLWKLAAGDAAAVEQIKQMNADVLNGAETVKVGMKLTLPAAKKKA